MKSDVYVPSGVPIIRGTNISSSREMTGEWVYVSEAFADAMPRCVVSEGDLVFPHRGSIGEVALVPGDRDRYFLSTSCMKITVDRQKADPRFVAYYFKSDMGRAEIMRFASQVGTPGIGQPLTSLRQFKLPAPPVRVQRAIANLLSSLDDKIYLNRRLGETLENVARTMFKSWFVDFDPVHAKSEGRSTNLPDDLAAHFPIGFGDDGLPLGWELRSADALIDVNPRTMVTGGAAPYVDMAALPTRGARIQSFVERPPGSGARFQNDDTLVARITPCLENGKTGLVDLLPNGVAGWGSTEFIVLRPRAGVPATWPYLLARNDSFRAFLITSMTGTSGRQRVPPSVVSRWQIATPPQQVLEAFGSATIPLFDRIRALDLESDTLRGLRDALLPKLVSGELRIADVEAKVSAA